MISIERHQALADAARKTLDALGVANVEILVADGSTGLPTHAPFDAIAVHATAPSIPKSLAAQLTEAGRLVLPLATKPEETLVLLTRDADTLKRQSLGPCRFVPLLGTEGF